MSIYHQRVEYPELVAKQAKKNGDTDSKPEKKSESTDELGEEDRPDNIRRLGL